jgi:rubrerythrin
VTTNHADPVFYCYVLLDPRKPGPFCYGKLKFDFEPFYVGKGTGKRCERHVTSAVRDPLSGNRHKKNKILNILRSGLDVVVHKGQNLYDEAGAHLVERKLIALIGRKDLKKGPLTNLTDGGEGSVNVAQVVRDTIGSKNSQAYHSKSAKEKRAFARKIGRISKEVWDSKSEEEKKAFAQLMSDVRNSRSEEARAKERKLRSKALRKSRAEETAAERQDRIENFKATMEAKPLAEKILRWSRISEGHASMDIKARKKRSKLMTQAWENRDPGECPHCGLQSKNFANLTRWHFDNCKAAP